MSVQLEKAEVESLLDLVNIHAKISRHESGEGYMVDDLQSNGLEYSDFMDMIVSSHRQENIPLYALKGFAICKIIHKNNDYVIIAKNNKNILIAFDDSYDNGDSTAQIKYKNYFVKSDLFNRYLHLRDDILNFVGGDKSVLFTKLIISGYGSGGGFAQILLIDALERNLVQQYSEGIFIALFSSPRVLSNKSVGKLTQALQQNPNITGIHLALIGDYTDNIPGKKALETTAYRVHKWGNNFILPFFSKTDYNDSFRTIKITPAFGKKTELSYKDERLETIDSNAHEYAKNLHGFGMLYTMLKQHE